MSYDYTMVGWLPRGVGEPLALASAALNHGVATTDGVERIWIDGLEVIDAEVDEDERNLGSRLLDLVVNLSLVLADHSGTDVDAEAVVFRHILVVASAFAAIDGFTGAVIGENYSNEDYIARIETGQVTLNSAFWDTWPTADQVLAGFSEPFPREVLRTNG